MTPTFYPPRLNSALAGFAQWLAPVVTRLVYQFGLEVDTASVETLRSLDGKRLLLLPNHPTFQDPLVMYTFSARTGRRFYYLAAIDLFMGNLGGLMQQLGVYSIRRGLMDRPSIAQTIDLLMQPNCGLVIFPEGGCSFQNDTVIPFRAGAIQLAFQALNRMAKQGEPIPDLYAVPISIKYRYTQNMAPVIRQTLLRLETALGLKSGNQSDIYGQLRAIAETVLSRIEQDYGLHTAEMLEKPWNDRIALLREQVLERCEQQLGLPSNSAEPVRERTYRLEYALKVQADALEVGDAETRTVEPQIDPFKMPEKNFKLLEKTVRRLLNFDAIYDGYVAENPTPERFLDTLVRLEREVFDIDRPPPKGFRRAMVKVGTPVNLKEAFERYGRDRSGTINAVTLQIQQTVQQNLDWLDGRGRQSSR